MEPTTGLLESRRTDVELPRPEDLDKVVSLALSYERYYQPVQTAAAWILFGALNSGLHSGCSCTHARSKGLHGDTINNSDAYNRLHFRHLSHAEMT